MRHNSKTWLGVFLALFFAVAMVVLQTPGTASALEDKPDDLGPKWDPTDPDYNANGKATFTGLNLGDKVTMYQIGSTNLVKNARHTSWIEPGSKKVIDNDKDTTYGCTVDAWIAAANKENPNDTTDLEALSNKIAGTAAGVIKDNPDGLTKFSSADAVADGVLTVGSLPAGLYYTVIDNGDNATYVYQNLITAVIPQPDNNKGDWHQPKGGSGPKRTQMDNAINQLVSDKSEGTFDQKVDTVGGGQTAFFKTMAMIPRYVGTDKDLNSRTLSFTIQYPNDTTKTPGKIDIQDSTFAIKSNGEDVKDLLKIQDNKDANPGVITISPDEGKMADFLKKAQGKSIAITYQGTVDKEVAPGIKMVVPVTQTFSENSWSKETITVSKKDDKPIQAEIDEFGLKVEKVSSEDPKKTKLANAKFELHRDTPTGELVRTVTTKGDGRSDTIPALGLGTYYLVEIATPAGYKVPTGDFANTKVTLTSEGLVDSVLTQTITNDPDDSSDQQILPTTGGPGTIALTVIGVGLMVAALVWIVRSRRHE